MTDVTSTGEFSLEFDPSPVLVPDFWNSLKGIEDTPELSPEDKKSLKELLAELVAFEFIKNSDEAP